MLSITPIPAFNDNYIWLITESQGSGCLVVDPGDAEPVREVLQQQGLTLAGILITHHHMDHVGGVERLLSDNSVPVYGPEKSPAQCITVRLKGGDQVDVLGMVFDVVEVPGHTLDHIAYFGAKSDRSTDPVVFCGDTLFAGGCGRVFEGTPQMMHASLSRLATLPPDTGVYCAHEYTLANLAFALAVEPENEVLASRIEADKQTRDLGQPTVPSTIALELATNPFLRSDADSVRNSAARHSGETPLDPVTTFAAIRQWKDCF